MSTSISITMDEENSVSPPAPAPGQVSVSSIPFRGPWVGPRKKGVKMTTISSVALRVANLTAMLDFYSQAFGVKFQEVDTYGIRSQFGKLNGITLKFVPIRDEADFKN